MSKLAWGIVGAGAIYLALGATAAKAESFPPSGSPLYDPAPMVTGDVLAGISHYSEPGFSTLDILGGARVNIPFGGAWNVTGEIAGIYAFKAPNFHEVGGGLHIFHKTQQFAHGAFLQGAWYGETGFAGSEWAVGVEGAAFFDSATLVGRVAYHLGNSDDGGYRYWSAEGVGRYYFTPNTKLAGILRVWNPSGFGTGIAVEHLFTGTNMTAFAAATWSSEGDERASEILGGVRFLFHSQGKTLQQHDWDLPFSSVSGINF